MTTGIASVLDFGAVGDGVTDDTTAVQDAIDTGRDVLVPFGYVFLVSSLSNFADGQRIFGGGCLKKDSSVAHLLVVPQGSTGVHFDGLELDGSLGSFTPPAAVSGIFGEVVNAITITNCVIHDFADCGVKLRDSANLLFSGNTVRDIYENGLEIRHYVLDPDTGQNYPVRPILEGNHRIVDNRFEHITRFENPTGPTVDACGVILTGAAGYPVENVIISNNHFVDCLRCVWAEQNQNEPLVVGLLVIGNTLQGGVSGGTAQGIYCKAGIGLVGATRTVVADNILKNVVNHHPSGTNTAGINVTGVCEDISIYGNSIFDDTGSGTAMEYGVHVLTGSKVRVHHNDIAGATTDPIRAVTPYVQDFQCYANWGADADQSWTQIVPFTFRYTDLPTSAVTPLLWEGEAGHDAAIMPTAGRIVGLVARLNTSFSSGTLDLAVLGDNVAEPGLAIASADFVGGATVVKRQASTAGNPLEAGEQIKVFATSNGLSPATLDIIVTVYVDISVKL